MTHSLDRYWFRAQRYLQEGNAIAARAALESLLRRDPEHTAAQLTLSCLAWEDGKVRDAAAHAVAAASHAPPDPALIMDICRSLLDAGETVAARELLQLPALAESTVDAVQLVYSSLLRKLGEHDRALRAVERAAALGARGSEFLFFRSQILTMHGRLADAAVDLDECLKGNPDHAQASLARALLRRQTFEHNHLSQLDAALERAAPGGPDRAILKLAKYKELEDLDQFDEAWQSLVSANADFAARWKYDRTLHHNWVETVLRTCSSDWMRSREHADSASEGPQPIFIFGMPRSGTTLLDRLLGAHPRVRSVGELDDFPAQLRWSGNAREALGEAVRMRLSDLDYMEIGARYLKQTTWRAGAVDFYIDKRPWNQLVAGLIHLALPHARMLRMVREPAAVCFSNFRAYLGDSFAYSYDLKALSDFHTQSARINRHWHAVMPGVILDVPYRELVIDTEATMRRVVAHCGLEWSPTCADPAANPQAVATPSAVRVREPIDDRGLREWRPYERQLSWFNDAASVPEAPACLA